MRACSMSEQDSHIPLDRRTFCDGCLGGGARSMSQGLRVLVLGRAISKSLSVDWSAMQLA